MPTSMRLAVGLIILTLACPVVWAADPAIVFVDEAKAGAKAIKVMDADGGNRREVFRTEKRFCDCGGTTLSPSISPDGEWVAYSKAEEGRDGEWYAIYKIPVAGGVPEKLLCSVSPRIRQGSPQWSPDGKEIAVHITDFFDGVQSVIIVPSDGIGCGTQPEVVYSSFYSSPPLWEIYRGFTWNADGSQIALLEVDLVALKDYLTIVDRDSGTVVARYLVDWPPGVVGGNVEMQLWDLDWQRSGSLDIAFHSTSGPIGNVERIWLLTVDEAEDLAIATDLAEGHSPTWSPDNSQLLFGDSQGLTRVTINGGTEFLGSGYDPDWARGEFGCETDLECNDGKECTTDACIGGSCTHDPLTGDLCGDSGWCQDGSCFEPECEIADECDDLNECTLNRCTDYECIFDAEGAAGLPCTDSDDCTENDQCDGFGGCAGDTIPGCGCLPKGDRCSSNSDCCSNKCRGGKCR